MALNDPVKSLIRISIYTSPVIGFLITMSSFKHFPFTLNLFLINALFAFIVTQMIWSVNIFLVYLNENKMTGKFGNKIRYLLSYIINISLCVISFIIIKSYIIHHPDSTYYFLSVIHRIDIHFPMGLGLFTNTIILIIQEIHLIKNKKSMIELENAQLKTKNAEAFYQQLKQQIHPHFLFNSLNILKTLIKKDPDTAIDYVVKLSDFLRMSISSNNVNIIKLEEELKLCSDYSDMQKLRFGNALVYNIDIPENIKSSGSVPVFSIQLLLENAIKHNSLTEESPLLINITYTDNYITVENNIQSKLSFETSTGFGLTNLSERYKILSGNDVIIKSNEKSFSVSIKVLEQ